MDIKESNLLKEKSSPDVSLRLGSKNESEDLFSEEAGVIEKNNGDVKKKGFFHRLLGKIDNNSSLQEESNLIESPSDSGSKEKNIDLGRDFDIKKEDLSSIKISDLRDMHKRKIEATKQEKTEEKRRIEERQKFVEARREEFRLHKEKESKEIDNMLGGTELLNKDSEHLGSKR